MTCDSSYYRFVRKDIAPLLPSTAHSILDIGCAEGLTTEWAAQQVNASRLVGMDISERVLEEARSHNIETRQVDLNVSSFPKDLGTFDLVLALDVLEHLVDPWSAVQAIHECLNPGGRLIISLPNIRYFEVSFGLAFLDRWNLKDAGIMDRTHLRFFVRSTALDLARSSGLHLVDHMTKLVRRRDRLLNAVFLNSARTLFAKQILVAVERRD
jgi:2-polyprenyl-3-methyl-5-hydroxy-6-metoxy-1,4-benzoquinol methylase